MIINVKKVTEKDVGEGFITELSRVFSYEDDNPKWILAEMKNFITDSHNIMLLGYVSGKMAGYLYGHILNGPDGKKKFLVYELSTNKEFRRQGIMSSIIDKLLDISKHDGLDSVWIPTEKDNVAAMNLYLKKGGIMQEGGVSFEYDLKKIMNKKIGLRTWIEVDRKALKNNYNVFRGLIPKKCLLMAVTKSNAYGHGFVGYSLELEKMGADWFGVDSITEALALRKNGIKKPILVLGYTLPENFKEAAKNNISLTISSFESLKILKRVQDDIGKLNIHLKIDTGMHRQGFVQEEVKPLAEFIQKNLPKVNIEGIYTHFAAAKDPSTPIETEKQIKEFENACNIIESAGFKPIKHAAATGGTIVFPQSHFDMVRIGIGLMGLWPSDETRDHFEKKIKIKPILSWKTTVAEVKKIKKGESVGYDFTETVERDSVIAILPIGYWHGYRRNLSSIGYVLISGKRAKILGRISMDMIVVDVANIKKVKVGSEAILIGHSGKENISAYELASQADTSWYEIVTQLNPLIKRFYI